MTIEKKLLGTSPSGGGPTDVADVFSTHLYTSTGSAQTINNGIDLAGEGGLVWCKDRLNAYDHELFDTERGLPTSNEALSSNTTGAKHYSDLVESFTSTGFTGTAGNNRSNVSWTFRKKKKFFDVVTYTGNGATSRNISHSLGVAPGMMIVKRYDGGSTNWFTYHISTGNNKYLYLNDTRASAVDTEPWAATTPTDSVFTVGLGNTNGNTNSFVAYLFADNSAEDAEDQMIKCGSFTGSATINLGWEPQFVLYKRIDSSDNWYILDTMRGWEAYRTNHLMNPLRPNLSNAEYSTSNYHSPTSTGIQFGGLGGSENYIYMAIRAPMMVEPKAATDVFKVDTRGSSGDGTRPSYRLGSPVDMLFVKNKTQANGTYIGSRLQGARYMLTHSSQTEAAYGDYKFDYPNGVGTPTNTDSNEVAWMWKRAKGYFDEVTWKGNATARTIPHSLGVAPEMIWVKNRDAVEEWFVYAASEGINKWLYLSAAGGSQSGIATLAWNNTIPSATVLSLGTHNFTNDNNKNLIAYLFATLDGISKVGSYTGNGSYQTINCGFSAGSRFILIKRTDANGDWYFWDSVRGIVAGNSPHLSLNTTAAQVTNDDSIDPTNAGFIVNQVSATNINVSSGTYIFYAIA